mgnify:CR=1 FL=1
MVYCYIIFTIIIIIIYTLYTHFYIMYTFSIVQSEKQKNDELVFS